MFCFHGVADNGPNLIMDLFLSGAEEELPERLCGSGWASGCDSLSGVRQNPLKHQPCKRCSEICSVINQWSWTYSVQLAYITSLWDHV